MRVSMCPYTNIHIHTYIHTYVHVQVYVFMIYDPHACHMHVYIYTCTVQIQDWNVLVCKHYLCVCTQALSSKAGFSWGGGGGWAIVSRFIGMNIPYILDCTHN